MWHLRFASKLSQKLSGYTAGHALKISEGDIDYMIVDYAFLSTFVHVWNFLINHVIT